MFYWSIRPQTLFKVSNRLIELKLINHQELTCEPDLSVEFATLGDLKVVERPTTQNLGPRDFLNVQSTIKVSSTDTGILILEPTGDPLTYM